MTIPSWYLAQGVKDVLVVDPHESRAFHHQHGAVARELALPATVDLHCGCRVRL